MYKNILSYLCVIFFLFGCSSSNRISNNNEEINIRSPEEIYISAMNYFDNKYYELANEEFNKIKQLYPLSDEAIQSEIMIGFIGYVQMDYDLAILKFKKITNKYPSLKDLDYVYYMIGMSYYEQISDHQLDGNFNELALDAFNQVIFRFPNTEFAKDSRQKIVLVKTNKAAKHMYVGRFYLKEKKYTAALNRFKIIIDEYSMTKFVPEALHRMVEAYYEMGMVDESIKIASTLGYNYPDSKWYKYSYKLINKTEGDRSFVNKVKNIFN